MAYAGQAEGMRRHVERHYLGGLLGSGIAVGLAPKTPSSPHRSTSVPGRPLRGRERQDSASNT